jgi:hypothetical protein
VSNGTTWNIRKVKKKQILLESTDTLLVREFRNPLSALKRPSTYSGKI